MSIKVNKICVYKDGTWHPITKVYKDGWKKFRGLFYDGNWYEVEEGEPFEDTYFEEYGALYNWWALDGLATDGWRIPDGGDRDTLRSYLGVWSEAGAKLKSTRTDPDAHPRWDSPNTDASDDYNFNALPAGFRNVVSSTFIELGETLLVMTSTYDGTYWLGSRFRYNHAGMYNTNVDSKRFGASIRVIRDATTNEQDSINTEEYLEEGVVQSEMYTGHNEKKYDAVRIGTQVWITENLKETKRKVGEDLVDIPIVTDNTTWSELETAAMCAYPKQ